MDTPHAATDLCSVIGQMWHSLPEGVREEISREPEEATALYAEQQMLALPMEEWLEASGMGSLFNTANSAILHPPADVPLEFEPMAGPSTLHGDVQSQELPLTEQLRFEEALLRAYAADRWWMPETAADTLAEAETTRLKREFLEQLEALEEAAEEAEVHILGIVADQENRDSQ